MKFDLHTHFYTEASFKRFAICRRSSLSARAQRTNDHHVSRRAFLGVTPAMTDVSKRLEDMDRVGIDVEVFHSRRRTSSSLTPSINPQSRG
jgi:hypothetical protein